MLFPSSHLSRWRDDGKAWACHGAVGRTLFSLFHCAEGLRHTAAGTLVDRGRATEMNLEILEEYIQQEWAPDFHYAHYDGIPWTPSERHLMLPVWPS